MSKYSDSSASASASASHSSVLFSFSCFGNTIIHSFKIFPRNKHILFCIFSLLTLPLSLLSSLALSSRPTKAHIYQLEAIAALTPTRFEARQIWKASCTDTLSLLKLKALYFSLSYPISIHVAASAISFSALFFHPVKQPTLLTAINAVKLSWKRVVATSIVIYVVMLLYAAVTRVFVALACQWFP